MNPIDHYQTMALTYEELVSGEHTRYPWVPLGNFLNDWFEYHPDERLKLIEEPLQLPKQPDEEQWKWAVFCVASVEYFALRYDVPLPEWIQNPVYVLDHCWFYSSGNLSEEEKQAYLEETPEPFKKRNIFCGKRIYANKWEDDVDERIQESEDHYKQRVVKEAKRAMGDEWEIAHIVDLPPHSEDLETLTCVHRVDLFHKQDQKKAHLLVRYALLAEAWSILKDEDQAQPAS